MEEGPMNLLHNSKLFLFIYFVFCIFFFLSVEEAKLRLKFSTIKPSCSHTEVIKTVTS